MITIAIGADHRGFLHKTLILEQMNELANDITWSDVGAFVQERSDYPLFATKVCHEILQKRAQLGVLLCGTGVGMSIAANRYRGIYAALAWNEEVAQLSRAHDCANVLVLPADFISGHLAVNMIRVWLATTPLLDEHHDRVEQIDRL
jgi:ribose 5-phosphate isomerase B